MAATAPHTIQESGYESAAPEGGGSPAGRPPAMVWRRRTLAALALLGCLGLFLLVRALAALPHIDAAWVGGDRGTLVLQASTDPLLQPLQGRALVAVLDSEGRARPVDSLLLHRSPRWQVNDEARARQVAQQDLLAQRLAAGSLTLRFDNGELVTLKPLPRGLAGLGLLVWPLLGMALLLALVAGVVVMARPDLRNVMFATTALCQAGNMVLIALASMRGLGQPEGLAAIDMPLRLVLDAITGAAVVHGFALHPRRLPDANAWALGAWGSVVAVLALVLVVGVPYPWWWAQGLCLALGLTSMALLRHAHRLEPNPYVAVIQRLNLTALATFLLVTAAVAAYARHDQVAHGVAIGASVAWYLFLASLVLLLPFLARSRQVLREFALLAGISTVAASVDLLFVAVFSLGAVTSLAVAVFAALAVYAGARQYILAHMLGASLLTTERTFDLLYRAARELQARPGRHDAVLARLLRELFEPLDIAAATRVPPRSRIVSGGAGLVVPVRGLGEHEPTGAVMLRFAQRGRRLFTHDDARLADRVVDQLRRAVAHDQAVERGRTEERQRLAQDLHDDIGARLLTLMYQAPNPAMEDYIRHTLQDLKTLTRGLAAAEHRLSHAAAEWKSDLSQRLAVAQAQLLWTCSFDEDLRLSVVQWSALTRVLRELVTNALYHGHATRIEVTLSIRAGRLELSVADDGEGRNPAAWSHGLGLGGVRKRVKALGGRVTWGENTPSGIVCEVVVQRLDSRA